MEGKLKMKSDKKIGILTFQNSDNYGALLQAYATQFILNKNGYKVEIIDYISKNKKDFYDLIKIGHGYSVKAFVGSLVRFPGRYVKWKQSEKFRKGFLNLSKKRYYDQKDLYAEIGEWSTIIVGSDQVWNYENTRFDTTYLLDIQKNNLNKVSYAASFGVSEISDVIPNIVKKYNPNLLSLTDEYKRLLNDFDHISVREQDGARIIEKLLDKDVEIVLDPTLLLSREEWLSVSKSTEKNEKYILIYSLSDTKELFEIAKKVSRLTGIEVRQICRGKMGIINGVKNIQPNFVDFPDCFRNASVVLTDSFHGTAFSINLEKDFYVYYNSQKNTYSRIDNLLKITGLEDRKVYGKDDISELNSPDYNIIRDKVSIEREKSIRFLLNSV